MRFSFPPPGVGRSLRPAPAAALLCAVIAASACELPDTDSEAPEGPYSGRAADPTTVAVSSPASGQVAPRDEFGDYWYQGEAELTSYQLSQARYGELRDGEAVLIFVTEDFSRSKLVKLNDWQNAGEDGVKVMKMNQMRNFQTGIYPYSTMTSVFTPVYESAPTLKTTTSVQEWCGHAYSEIRRQGRAYQLEQRSYFEGEERVDADLGSALLEDAIWTRLRLDPNALPVGRVEVVPGQLYARFAHRPVRRVPAAASREENEDGTMTYRLKYDGIDRELAIRYQPSFPHHIEGWEETARSGFGEAAGVLTTRAILKARIMTDYWRHNGVGDEAWREKLALAP